jgi:hypothetical protein
MGNRSTTTTTNPDALQLLSASMSRDIEKAHFILKHSVAHIHARGEHNRTPILLCCALGSKPAMYDCASRSQFLGYLLSRGARVSDRDDLGWTPLHHCCAVGDFDGVRLLITNGANPDATSNQGIPAIEFLHRDYVVPGRVIVPPKDEHFIQKLKQTSMERQKERRNPNINNKVKFKIKNSSNHNSSSSTGFEDFHGEGFDEDIEDDFNDIALEKAKNLEEEHVDGDHLNTIEKETKDHFNQQVDQLMNENVDESWKMDYCSLRCSDVVKRGDPLVLEYTRGNDHHNKSYVQLYYVDRKPWMLRKRIGSYKTFPPDLQSGTLIFSTKRLSVNGRFRFLYHSGSDNDDSSSSSSNGSRRRDHHRVLCSSNAFKISDPGVSSRSLVAAALNQSEKIKRSTSCGFDEDEFSVHLDQDRSWALPRSGINNNKHDSLANQYHNDIIQLSDDETIWLNGIRSPPPMDYLIDLILSKVDIALAMEDDKKLISKMYSCAKEM